MTSLERYRTPSFSSGKALNSNGVKLSNCLLSKGSTTRAINLNQTFHIERHTPKLKPQAVFCCGQDGVLRERIGCDGSLKTLIVAVGLTRAARVEVKSLAQVTHKLNVRVPPAVEQSRFWLDQPFQVFVAGRRQDHIVKGFRRAVRTDQRQIVTHREPHDGLETMHKLKVIARELRE